jgi:hypothetical protein
MSAIANSAYRRRKLACLEPKLSALAPRSSCSAPPGQVCRSEDHPFSSGPDASMSEPQRHRMTLDGRLLPSDAAGGSRPSQRLPARHKDPQRRFDMTPGLYARRVASGENRPIAEVKTCISRTAGFRLERSTSINAADNGREPPRHSHLQYVLRRRKRRP